MKEQVKRRGKMAMDWEMSVGVHDKGTTEVESASKMDQWQLILERCARQLGKFFLNLLASVLDN